MDKIIIIMPAYNAEQTLNRTYQELPKIYSEIILCDDGSKDKTVEISRTLNITTLFHKENKGYGANQKTLYNSTMQKNPEIIVMVHPDNQYDTNSIPLMVEIIRSGKADMVLGSRIKTALQNGMPYWKYISNRFLSFMQNLIFKTNLSEFHSGLRAYKASIFLKMPYQKFKDDFTFDSEIIAWLIAHKMTIKEIDTQCFYTKESISKTNLRQSINYGIGTLKTLIKYLFGYYKNLK
ncbi:MAG: glycosyltransferase family 2 protein [Patescibacteria group bacterium]|nr:glycosyltransferase family 2 protein [Patescibacteria group bacterium]